MWLLKLERGTTCRVIEIQRWEIYEPCFLGSRILLQSFYEKYFIQIVGVLAA